MAVLANSLGYLFPEGAMIVPRAKNVQEALQLSGFSSYGETPRIASLLGAEPSGGFYLIACPKKDFPADIPIRQAIDSAKCSGLVEAIFSQPFCISSLEETTLLKQSLTRDQALILDHLDLPDCKLIELRQ